jgi:hypothetical protein
MGSHHPPECADANWGYCELTGPEENDRQFGLLFLCCAQMAASQLSIGWIQSEVEEGAQR